MIKPHAIASLDYRLQRLAQHPACHNNPTFSPPFVAMGGVVRVHRALEFGHLLSPTWPRFHHQCVHSRDFLTWTSARGDVASFPVFCCLGRRREHGPTHTRVELLAFRTRAYDLSSKTNTPHRHSLRLPHDERPLRQYDSWAQGHSAIGLGSILVRDVPEHPLLELGRVVRLCPILSSLLS